MKAAVLEGINKLSVREVPTPSIADDEILLRVDSCGICGSDLRIISGGNARVKYPQVIGHEIAGTVVSVGKKQKKKFNAGDRVALSADVPCGSCEWCKRGLSNHCINNIAFGHEYAGGFAEYLKLTRRIIEHGPLVVLPETKITQDEFSLCEPLACCINGLEICGMRSGKSSLIYGAGPVGCMLADLGKAMDSPSITLCDTDPERLAAAKVCDADMFLSFSDLDCQLKGQRFDIVITACPSVEAQESALKYVGNRGVVNFFGGLAPGTRNISISSNEIHYKEITVLGSHGSTPRHHKIAVDMLLSGRLSVKKFISKRYPLERIHEAMEDARNNKKNLKIVINP